MAITALIIDDAVVYRKIISDVLGTFPDVETVDKAASGEIALKMMEQSPHDLVFCDLYMPRKDGVETLIEIRKRFPDVNVIMMSSIATRGAEVTVKALELGALDFIQKPEGLSSQETFEVLKYDIAGILRLVKVRRQTTNVSISDKLPKFSLANGTSVKREKRVDQYVTPKRFSVVVIGISTGGPEALNKLIPALPQKLAIPVLLVQHMPPNFTKALAESLARKSQLKVKEAIEGEPVKSGMVYIAPGGRHMTVRKTNNKHTGTNGVIIGINDGPPENSCRPSVDVLFRSVADVYGDAGVLAVIMTGMGNDGASGMRALKRKECYSITQSESNCVIYGMPRIVDEAGMSDISLSLDEIAREISRKLK